jgi:hypothetical protein
MMKVEVCTLGEIEKVRVKGIGVGLKQGVLHPPQVPDELPGIPRKVLPNYDAVRGMRGEGPGLNDGRN